MEKHAAVPSPAQSRSLADRNMRSPAHKNHSVAPRTPGASRKKRSKTSGGTARHVSPRMPLIESNRKMSLLVYAAEILLLFAVIALVVRFIPDFSKKGRGRIYI